MLYGFAHADERRCFEALLGAHGVGPTLALSILSSMSPAALSTAVLEDDAGALCLVPGVGKKTAARLLLELKARLDLPSLGGGPSSVRARRASEARERPGRARLRARGDPGRARRRRRGQLGGGPGALRPARAGPRPVSTGARREVLGSARPEDEDDEAGRARPPGRPRPGPGRGGRGGRAPAPQPRRVHRPGPAHRAPADRHRGGAASGASPSTTCCSPGRPASARRRWPASWPPRWASGCGSPPDRSSSGPATWPRCSPTSRRATSCSSTRSTGCTGRSRRSSTRPWRTSSSTSSSARGPRRAASGSTCPGSPWSGATTRTGLVAGPLRDRFGFVGRLDHYDVADLRGHRPPVGGHPRACRSTPTGPGASPSGRGGRRASPTGCCAGCGTTSRSGPRGASPPRRRSTGSRSSASTSWVSTRSTVPSSTCSAAGSPAGRSGLTTLAQCVGEEPDTIEDAYEPYLLQQGLVQRTTRGRVAAPRAWAHLGLVPVEPTRSSDPGPGRGRRSASMVAMSVHVGVPARAVPMDPYDYAPAGRRHRPAPGRAPGPRPACSSAPGWWATTSRATPPWPICPRLLRPGDVLVVNDTRVLAARLRLTKAQRRAGRGAPPRTGRRRSAGPAQRRARRPGRRWCAPAGGCLRAPSSSSTPTARRWSRSGPPPAVADDGRRLVRLLDRSVVERAGAAAAAALHPHPARRPRALPDGLRPVVRARGPLGGRTHRRAALHPGAARRLPATRRRHRPGGPRHRARHLPPGHGAEPPRST